MIQQRAVAASAEARRGKPLSPEHRAKVKAAQDAGEQISVKELAAVELAKMKLLDLSNTWSQTVITMVDGVSKAFGTVFKQFADQLLQGQVDITAMLKSLGDAIANVFIDIAQKAIERFVKETLLGILDDGFLAEATKAKLMGTATTAATAEMQAGIQAVTASVTELNSQLTSAIANMNSLGASAGDSGITGAAGAAGGAGNAAGAGGGILGAAGSIGSIVGAISSIIGNFQTARTNNLLGEIEVTTRKIQNILGNTEDDGWLRETHLMVKLDDLVNNHLMIGIGEITKGIVGLSDDLEALDKTMTKLASTLDDLVNKPAGTVTGGVTINIDALAFAAPIVTGISALSAMAYQQFNILEGVVSGVLLAVVDGADRIVAAVNNGFNQLINGAQAVTSSINNTMGSINDGGRALAMSYAGGGSGLLPPPSSSNVFNINVQNADEFVLAQRIMQEIQRRVRS